MGVQGNAENQGLIAAMLLHLIELRDDHVGEIGTGCLAQHYRIGVVEFLRIRHGEQAARARAEPDGLVVHCPVQQKLEPGFLQ